MSPHPATEERNAPAVLRRRMSAPRTLLWLVCIGIALLTFVLVFAGTALAAGPNDLGRIPGACFAYGLVWGLPALFVLSRFAVVEIARTPQRGYRRRVLLLGVPLSVRTVPEGRIVRVREAGYGGSRGIGGFTPSARLCIARADGHHLLLCHLPCYFFGLDALPEAAFAPLDAAEPDARPAVDGAPPSWVEESLPPHTGTKRGERRREAALRARAEVLAGLQPDDALAVRAGNSVARVFFLMIPFVVSLIALAVVDFFLSVSPWIWLAWFVGCAACIVWLMTGLRNVRCPRCGAPVVPVRTVENGTRHFWFVCHACGIYAPGSDIGPRGNRATPSPAEETHAESAEPEPQAESAGAE